MRHKKSAKPHTESRPGYIAALAKYPEIMPRKHRRAAWLAHRREASTHQVAPDNFGTHKNRTKTWRSIWILMSDQAGYMNSTRKAELLSAAAQSQ